MNIHTLITLVSVGGMTAMAATPGQQYVVDVTPAYVVPAGEGAERGSVSPDGSRLAAWISVGERGYIWCDGTRSRMWDAVLLPKFSSDSRHVAFIGLEESGAGSYQSYIVFDSITMGPFSYLAFDRYGTDELVFSKDGKHFAFRAWEGKSAYVIVDGRRDGPYGGVVGPPPEFSPDGRRLAYFVTDSAGSRAIIDGQAGRTFARTAAIAGFSDDSKSYAYVGIANDSAYWVIRDSSMFGPYWRMLAATYRPGTRELWYSAARDSSGGDSLYQDGRAVVGYRRIREITFSDDGSRIGYVAGGGDGRSIVVIDSSKQVMAERVEDLQFAANGRHCSYREVNTNDSLHVPVTLHVDEYAFGPFAEISPAAYSPDGRQFLFVAVDTSRSYFAVVDSNRFGPFDSAAVVGWSRDSRHYAFTTAVGDTARMYLDGVAGPSFRHVMRQVWNDTLHGNAAYIADPEAKGITLVVNDSALVPLDYFFGAARGFGDDGSLSGYGQRGDTIVRFIVRPAK